MSKTDKELLARFVEKVLENSNEKNRKFYRYKIRTVNSLNRKSKQVKSIWRGACPQNLVIRRMQIKTMRYTLQAKIESAVIPTAGKSLFTPSANIC